MFRGGGLPAKRQACGQALRQAAGDHQPLRFLNGVIHPAVFDSPGFRVQNDIAGAGITVAGLPHSTRVDKPALLTEWHRIVQGHGQGIAFLVGGLLQTGKDDGNVRMAKKAIESVKIGQIRRRYKGVRDVFPDWMAGAAVDDSKAVLNQLFGQAFDVFPVVGRPCLKHR